MHEIFQKLIEKYPELDNCLPDILEGNDLLVRTFSSGRKLLVCGTGGSAADSEHIVGELMKGYLLARVVPTDVQKKLFDISPQNGSYLFQHLQGALPAISLVSQVALNTAFTNDVAADMVFAQQVYGYGQPGDCLLGLSTSGNAINVIHAFQVAKAMRMSTLGLTGRGGGKMREWCDVTIRVPWDDTPSIQERHLPIIHALCASLEEFFFG